MDTEQVAGSVAEAEQIIEGGQADVARVRALVDQLRKAGRFDVVASLLIVVARQALYENWERQDWADLAEVLRDNQQFGYARRLFGRLSSDTPEDSKLRQQYALCVYKDMELPAARRLDRALEILRSGEDLDQSTDAETLGLAGAVYKRKWEVDAKRADLENAHWCYLRGWEQHGHPQQRYAGINAAFVLDNLAALEERDAIGPAPQADALYEQAARIRRDIVEMIEKRRDATPEEWDAAILGEALFGLRRFGEAKLALEDVRRQTSETWKLESTATQLAAIARLKDFGATARTGHERAAQFAGSDAGDALQTLLGEDDGAALRRTYLGKVGLALSGGGFRASLFHVGVLAALAERDLLRHVEVLSCVSGGSILGAYYYLKLRKLLHEKPDQAIQPQDYVDLVGELADEFLAGVQQDLRGRLTSDVGDNWKMLRSSRYSRSDRVSELLEELIFSRIPKGAKDDLGAPWRMTDLYVNPPGRERGFSPRYENWRRGAKVPILVINATTLNTGHNWQFTASWMGEPPSGTDERVDANPRLRRMYYSDAPPAHRKPPLANAVAASACVPALFPPITLDGLYDESSVELVDGGVHDNQGVGGLLDQDCTVILVSDASGQMGEQSYPNRTILGTSTRSNSILMSRVRGAQYADLASRLRSGTLRRLMIVHLKKGLPVEPRNWRDCPEPWDPSQEEVPLGLRARQRDYGIHEDVQRDLAELRTDLDSFSNAEAYSLMAAGYKMTHHELAVGLPDFPEPDPPLGDVRWPFEEALGRIAAAPEDSSLAVELAVGSKRFFRRYHAWRLRRSSRPPGRLRRFLDRTRLSGALAGGAGTAKSLVGTPLRAAASAPLAAAGALATRVSSRFRRRPAQ